MAKGLKGVGLLEIDGAVALQAHTAVQKLHVSTEPLGIGGYVFVVVPLIGMDQLYPVAVGHGQQPAGRYGGAAIGHGHSHDGKGYQARQNERYCGTVSFWTFHADCI